MDNKGGEVTKVDDLFWNPYRSQPIVDTKVYFTYNTTNEYLTWLNAKV